jgi:hypothetical protein
VLATHSASFQLLALDIGALRALGWLQHLGWIDDVDIGGVRLAPLTGVWVARAWPRFLEVGWGRAMIAGGLVALGDLPTGLEYRDLLSWPSL